MSVVTDLERLAKPELIALVYEQQRRIASLEQEVQRLIGRSVGIHWETLDEDLSVAGLLRGNPPCGSTG